jgi:hypothetical protein
VSPGNRLEHLIRVVARRWLSVCWSRLTDFAAQLKVGMFGGEEQTR